MCHLPRSIPVLFTLLLASLPAAAQDCDRDCLRSTITTYLDAMLKQDPSLAPLAPDVRFVEDQEDLQPGEGLWQNIQGYGTFRQDILDVREGVAGTHVVAMENGQPVLTASGSGLRRVSSPKSNPPSSAIRKKA